MKRQFIVATDAETGQEAVLFVDAIVTIFGVGNSCYILMESSDEPHACVESFNDIVKQLS